MTRGRRVGARRRAGVEGAGTIPAVDTKAVGTAAVQLMDDLGEDVPEEAEIEAVALVVSVSYVDDSGEEVEKVMMRCSEGTERLKQLGLLFEAQQLVSAGGED